MPSVLCSFVCGAHAVCEIAIWVVLTASTERFPPPHWIGDLPTELSERRREHHGPGEYRQPCRRELSATAVRLRGGM